MIARLLIFLWMITMLASCQKEDKKPLFGLVDGALVVPEGFSAMDIPDNSPLTEATVALGRRLFYSPLLSRNSSISCASCHKLDLAMADNVPVSAGVNGRLGTRNATSLMNVGYQTALLRSSELPDLEFQALVPIEEFAEFDHNLVLIVDRLKDDASWQAMAEAAYGTSLNEWAIVRGLASFQRTMVSANSPYDQHFLQGKTRTLTSTQLAGKTLFESDSLACAKCHSGIHFTDFSLKNNGLYEVYLDKGRERFTKDSLDNGLFKVPSLRQIALTSPYMHDGSIHTLTEVIEHYESGGKQHFNKSIYLKGFKLSANEKQQLISFLESLTDVSFLHRTDLKAP